VPNRLSANTSLRTERNRALEQRVQTADYGDLLYLVGNLLQRLEFLEPHQQRIILHQFGRVEQRPRCGRLFTTANQVGLRLLFGGDYLVEDVANVSGQDDVLESNYAQRTPYASISRRTSADTASSMSVFSASTCSNVRLPSD